jgi:hypothetical protein
MQKVGYILVGAGIVAIAAWVGRQLFIDPEIAAVIKVAIAVVVLGLLVLLGVVLRDRVRASRNDRFKGVER